MSEENVSIGEYLRRARLLRRLSLEDISRELHIRTDYLQALEQDDWSKLPGEVYGLGFLRNYARFLDLDGEALVHYYKSQHTPLAEPKPAKPPDALPRRRSARQKTATRAKPRAAAQPSSGPTNSRSVVMVALVLVALFIAGLFLLPRAHTKPLANPSLTRAARPAQTTRRTRKPTAVSKKSATPSPSTTAPTVQLLSADPATATATYAVLHVHTVDLTVTFTGLCWAAKWVNGVEQNPSGHLYNAGQSLTVQGSHSAGVKLGTRYAKVRVNGVRVTLPFTGLGNHQPLLLMFRRSS